MDELREKNFTLSEDKLTFCFLGEEFVVSSSFSLVLVNLTPLSKTVKSSGVWNHSKSSEKIFYYEITVKSVTR